MSKPLPFTKASIRRAIAGARAAGLCVREIKPDGSILVDDPSSGASITAPTLQNDPYVTAIERGSDAKAQRKRYARS